MNVFKATNSSMVVANYIVQLVAVGALLALPYKLFVVDWRYIWQFALALVFWQVFNVVGIAAGAHRYFSHYAFKCNRFWQWAMAYFCMVSLVGPPCIWAEAHRVHHQHSDTDKDPYLKWMLDGDSPVAHTTTVTQRFVTKMARKNHLHMLTMKYYWLYVTSWVCLSFVAGYLIPGMDPLLGVIVFWVIPAGLSQLTLRLVLWTGHLKNVGYRNYDTKDTSNNWWIMSLIAAGEGWHNNHHKHPGAAKSGERWWEFDPTWWFIKFIKE